MKCTAYLLKASCIFTQHVICNINQVYVVSCSLVEIVASTSLHRQITPVIEYKHTTCNTIPTYLTESAGKQGNINNIVLNAN